MIDKELENIRSMLWAHQTWPGIYFFKFIVPNDKEKLNLIRGLFLLPDQITYRTSKDIRFIALSCKQMMKNPDEVLAVYEKAKAVEGVIAL
ncbi:MAG: hypothetical protein WCK18_05215 [Prolixibacteraceae bacterium]